MVGFRPDLATADTAPKKEVVDFERSLINHQVDVEPTGEGRRELLAGLGGSSFGCQMIEIGRAEPAVTIEKMILEPGKSIALIGPNGSGKSTVFDAMMGIRDAFLNHREGVGAYLYGKPVHSRKKLRIARLNQEEQLAEIGDQTAAAVLQQAEEKNKQEFEVDWEDMDKYEQNLENEEVRQRIEELRGIIVKIFEMEEFIDRPVKDLSGGERTKLALFKVLLSEPDILLLDEPTNHLDLESIAKLTGLIEKYQRAGIAVVSASHVDWFLEQVGKDGVWEIQSNEEQRKVVTSSSKHGDYLKNKARQEFTVIENGIEWQIGDEKKGQTLLSPFTTEDMNIPDSPLKKFRMDSLQHGEVWVLSGKNGSGKTKLMEVMADKKKRRGLFNAEKGASFAYLPQFWPEEIAQGSLNDFFNWVKQSVSPFSDINEKKFVAKVQAAGFRSSKGDSRMDRSWLKNGLNTFSGGEQRVLWFIAVSCFSDVDGLFLDEPTNHMDKNVQAIVAEAIKNFGGAVVLSTHDIKLLEYLSDVGGSRRVRNIVLEKDAGVTTVHESGQSPVAYMKSKLKAAKEQGRRIKI